MVPGALRTEIPNFAARPLRGLTCASVPSGKAMNRPVGTIALSRGPRVIGSVIFALRSIPADFSVAYAGTG